MSFLKKIEKATEAIHAKTAPGEIDPAKLARLEERYSRLGDKAQAVSNRISILQQELDVLENLALKITGYSSWDSVPHATEGPLARILELKSTNLGDLMA